MHKQFALSFLIVSSLLPAASFSEEIGWLKDADQAWARSTSEGRPLLVFITRANCKFCTQMKRETFADAAVAARIKSDYVPLAIDPATEPGLVKELKITSFPTTIIISAEAVTLQKIKGYLPPREFEKRLAQSRVVTTASQPGNTRR